MYSQDKREQIITDICDRVINEKISFNQAVADSEITLVSFYKWICDNPDLEKLYKYAREIRSDVLFEEIIDIADNTEEGEEIEVDGEGNIIKKKIGDLTRHRQLKIDARKWVVCKMQPKKYGDKLDLTTDGEKITAAPPTIVFKDSFDDGK